MVVAIVTALAAVVVVSAVVGVIEAAVVVVVAAVFVYEVHPLTIKADIINAGDKKIIFIKSSNNLFRVINTFYFIFDAIT